MVYQYPQCPLKSALGRYYNIRLYMEPQNPLKNYDLVLKLLQIDRESFYFLQSPLALFITIKCNCLKTLAAFPQKCRIPIFNFPKHIHTHSECSAPRKSYIKNLNTCPFRCLTSALFGQIFHRIRQHLQCISVILVMRLVVCG